MIPLQTARTGLPRPARRFMLTRMLTSILTKRSPLGSDLGSWTHVPPGEGGRGTPAPLGAAGPRGVGTLLPESGHCNCCGHQPARVFRSSASAHALLGVSHEIHFFSW